MTQKCLLLSVVLTCAMSTLGAEFDIHNEAEFKKLIPEGAKVEKLATGFKFLEGSVWVPQHGGFLVFSDIPANDIKKWTAKDGVTVYRNVSNNSNGNTVDNQGRIVTCEHSGRRVSIEEKDGAVHTLVADANGKKFNSPNDVVVKSDGTIWFTDPDYGLGNNPKETGGNFIYRFEPKTKNLSVVARDFHEPNGLCFSPDEKKLYIADSGQPRHIRVFDVKADGTLSGGSEFCKIDSGVPDGIRCDKDGRIWASADKSVQIFAPSGELVAKILVPETPANLCFGGKDGKTLFIAAQTSLYKIETNVKGAK